MANVGDGRPAARQLVLTGAMLLCMAMASCSGGRSTSTGSSAALNPDLGSSTRAASGTYLESDADSDKDDGNSAYALKTSAHDSFVAPVDGAKAGSADRQAISALIERYYTAAAAGDGATGCALLSRQFATSLPTGGASSGAEDCPAALSRIFRAQHGLLAEDEVATMSVVEVRVSGNAGAAIVGFKHMPVGKLRLRREHGAWKMNALLDTGLD